MRQGLLREVFVVSGLGVGRRDPYTRAVSHYHQWPTEAQQERFLELVAEGLTRQEAAEHEDVGATATQFRTFINGKKPESLAFAERYQAVLEEIGAAPTPVALRIKELEGVQMVHRLLDEALLRALDPERGKVGASNRVLHNLLLLKADDFRPLLEARTRHIHEGAVGIYAMPQIDTSRWTLEQHEEFVQLEARRSELIAMAQPDGQVALPAARDDDVVVEEAEVEEIEAA